MTDPQPRPGDCAREECAVHDTVAMPPHEHPVICLKDVSFSYDVRPILTEVNLDVHDREFAVVVGPNGGGKTTLLRLILGVLTPRRGSVTVFGKSPASARARIGYTPQHTQFDPLFPVSVMDVVLMGRVDRCLGGRYRREDVDAAQGALNDVSLGEEARRPFASLSGGQRQRALIARALACEPDLLLLDEPTANLDVSVGRRLLELLQKLNLRMTIVMVSHDLGFVSSVVGSVVCVNRTVSIHPTGEVTQDAIHHLFGEDVRIILHDHNLPKERHLHE